MTTMHQGLVRLSYSLGDIIAPKKKPKPYRLTDISEGRATVTDAEQGICRGYVDRCNGQDKLWRAWYPSERWLDRSGGEPTYRHARLFTGEDMARCKRTDLVARVGIDHRTSKATGHLLFRTRHDAALFAVLNG